MDANGSTAPDHADDMGVSSKSPWIRRLMVVTAILLVAVLVSTIWWSQSELRRRHVCASIMKDIVNSGKIYNILDGHRPGRPAPVWLDAHGRVSPPKVPCPSSGLETSNYLVAAPPDFTGSLPDTAVILYEPKTNHGGEGGNIAFADGHVRFVRVPEYDKFIAGSSSRRRR